MLKSNDGRNMVDRYHDVYEGMDGESFVLECRIVKRWLNQFFRE